MHDDTADRLQSARLAQRQAHAALVAWVEAGVLYRYTTALDATLAAEYFGDPTTPSAPGYISQAIARVLIDRQGALVGLTWLADAGGTSGPARLERIIRRHLDDTARAAATRHHADLAALEARIARRAEPTTDSADR